MPLSGLGLAKKIVDTLTPDDTTERIRFTRFAGRDLEKAIIEGKPDVKGTTVILKINPQDMSFVKRKIINKVQTASPNRFVVFDWGHELTVVDITGATGNLLPETLSSSGLEPVSNAIMEAASFAGTGASDAVQGALQDINSVGRNINAFKTLLNGGLTYSDILDISPKYRRFKDLEKMYDMADADNDIITMEVGENVYRGFFEEFAFSITADSPWNWQYKIVFVILANLTELELRFTATYNKSGVEAG